MKHRLTPVSPPYSERVSSLLAHYPKRDGYLLALFRVFANSERFLRKGVPDLLDRDSPLSMTEREIVILRVTALRRCEYEWGIHVAAFAQAAKLSSEQVRSTLLGGANDACWSSSEAALVRTVDELLEEGRLSGKTKAAFEEYWSPAQQLEILALCGAYQTVSFVANVSAIPPEDFAARFPG